MHFLRSLRVATLFWVNLHKFGYFAVSECLIIIYEVNHYSTFLFTQQQQQEQQDFHILIVNISVHTYIYPYSIRTLRACVCVMGLGQRQQMLHALTFSLLANFRLFNIFLEDSVVQQFVITLPVFLPI